MDEGAAWSLGDETAKVAKSKIPPMVAASRWAAGGAWNVALANHDTFPLGENCAYGGRGFGRGVLLRPLISDISLQALNENISKYLFEHIIKLV